MHENGRLPRARLDGLLEETVGEELLLYDQNSHIAHCLSPIAACVWRHCDGERNLTDLAVLAGANEDLVADALHELREKDLLDAQSALIGSIVPGESRREAIGRIARYGAAAAAVPLVVSATAATPAMAATMCKPSSTTNCCVCKTCCKNASSALNCTNECNESNRGGKVSYTEDMECVAPGGNC
jgi:hypothetical protein